MRTMFTQVLTEEEWLALFDHLFMHSDSPNLLLIGVVAYLIYFRSSILTARSSDDVLSLLRRQNPINMDEYIKLIFELRSRTKDSLLPSPKADKIGVGGGIGGAMESSSGVATEGGSDSNAANVLGGFPIPSGSYPLFERYPKYVVDFQLQERSRLENEERSIKKKT